MESPDFYLTLPSNASMNTHPDNTLTHYITQRLNLSGQWECGLVEILYPHSWYNVREQDASFGIGLRNTDETEEITTTRTRIEVGYYQGPQIFVKTINKALLRALPANVVRLSYSVITHKMTLTMLSNVVFLGDMNTTILGFRDNPLIGPNDGTDIVREADSVVDMSRGFESLYVYTDVVEPRVVGDSLVPLLRIVPLNGRQGDTVSKTYKRRSTYPYWSKSLVQSRLIIRDDTGRPVPFERGKVVVTLHFRRIKSRLF